MINIANNTEQIPIEELLFDNEGKKSLQKYY